MTLTLLSFSIDSLYSFTSFGQGHISPHLFPKVGDSWSHGSVKLGMGIDYMVIYFSIITITIAD